MTINLKTVIAAAMLMTGSVSAWSAWSVDGNASTFDFVTTKAGEPGTAAITESQSFKQVAGSVSDAGKIRFDVDLTSVDTRITVRNDRIQTLLFNVAQHPKATFISKINLADFTDLSIGNFKDLTLNGELTIAGQSQTLNVPVRVVNVSSNRLLVSSLRPVVVNLADFGLQSGVQELRDLMKLDVLSASAPVSFSLVLRRSK